MGAFRICFGIQMTRCPDGLDVKSEGMDKPNLRNMVMPLMDMQEETGGRIGRCVNAV